MLVLLILLFIVVPLAELYVIIRVGELIGALPTIGLLVADSVLGSLLLRSQGRATWRRFNAALARRRPPAREVLDGALVIGGGSLLIAPGFLTDLLGFALLLPPSRAVFRRIIVRRVTHGVLGRVPGRGARDVDGAASEAEHGTTSQ